MNGAMIQVRDITKFYGPARAIEQVSFSVNEGETVGLLGTNGSGKTTTIRILTGFIPPTRGEVHIQGYNTLTQSLQARRLIGYLPESAPFYGELSVIGSLRFFAQMHDLRGKRLAQRVDDVINAFGLDAYAEVIVGKLSKGYRQRLGIAQAVIHEPEVLVLDEPTVGIDPVQIQETRHLIQQLSKRHTILLSTHQLGEATQLCNRVLILDKGRLVADGDPGNLIASAEVDLSIEIEARGDPETIKSILTSVPGLGSVQLVAETAPGVYMHRIEANGLPPDINEQIVTALIEKGYPIRSLKPVSGGLERAFIKIAGKSGGNHE